MLQLTLKLVTMDKFRLNSTLTHVPVPIAAPSVLLVRLQGRARKELRKPILQPGEIRIKECTQEPWISFLKNMYD